jgi:hypothetical protein
MKKIVTLTGIAAVLALSGCAVPTNDVETGSDSPARAAAPYTDQELWDLSWDFAMKEVVTPEQMDQMCLVADMDISLAVDGFMLGFGDGAAAYPTWTDADIRVAAADSIRDAC